MLYEVSYQSADGQYGGHIIIAADRATDARIKAAELIGRAL